MHTLIGAVEFSDQSEALGRILQCKREVGASDEIKWNSKKFTREQRHFISDALLPVLNRTVGFLIIREGNDKQASAVSLMNQLSDYCRSLRSDAYVITFDKNIVRDSRSFDSQLSELQPGCMGWSEVDSAHNPLIQAADLFCGFQKLRIDIGEGRVNPNRLVVLESEGNHQECELSWYLFAGLHYSLWGRVHDHGWDPPKSYCNEPLKHNLGYGVRVFSTVPREPLLSALTHLDREFMGCIR